MAGSPRFKVYTADNIYLASCKQPEDAAAIIGNYYMGTIRIDIYSLKTGNKVKSVQTHAEAWALCARVPGLFYYI